MTRIYLSLLVAGVLIGANILRLRSEPFRDLNSNEVLLRWTEHRTGSPPTTIESRFDIHENQPVYVVSKGSAKKKGVLVAALYESWLEVLRENLDEALLEQDNSRPYAELVVTQRGRTWKLSINGRARSHQIILERLGLNMPGFGSPGQQ